MFYQLIFVFYHISTHLCITSNRKVTIQTCLAEELSEYCRMLYGIKEKERMFRFTKSCGDGISAIVDCKQLVHEKIETH